MSFWREGRSQWIVNYENHFFNVPDNLERKKGSDDQNAIQAQPPFSKMDPPKKSFLKHFSGDFVYNFLFFSNKIIWLFWPYRHTGPSPSSILVHRLKSIFFDVSDDLEQKKTIFFLWYKKIFGLVKFFIFFSLEDIRKLPRRVRPWS